MSIYTKLILSISLFITVALLALFALPRSANAVSCANVPVGGNYTVTADCTFANTVDGVDNGGMTINTDTTLTINTGQTIAWTSGYSITINGTIAMSGGELRKTNLWLIDTDADGYPTSATQIAQTDTPTGGRRRKDISSGTNSSFTYVADITEFDYDDTDNTIYYGTVCGGDCSTNNSAGDCVAVSAGENSLAVCKRCNGSSLSSVNIADNTQDTEGSNVCSADCVNCNGSGSCVNQTNSEDLFTDCGTTNCSSGNCNGSGACGYLTSGEGNCAACKTCVGATSSSCVNIADNTQDAEGSNVCSATCKNCNGSGSCVNQGVEDLFNQCGTTNCSSGNCNGSGACGYLTSGDGNCATCGTCVGATSASCVNYTNNTQDTGCTGTCQACQSGSCSNASNGTDPGSDCGTTNCNTGNCDGVGACGYYTSGIHNCSDSYVCNGSGVCTFTCGTSTVDDGDSNTYNTVAITNGGYSECWMATNLYYDWDGNSKCSENGWVNSTDTGWCGYHTSNSGPNTDYGLLYQWSAAVAGDTSPPTQGICPTGWHIPTDAEQHALDDAYDSGSCNAGRVNAWDCDPAGTALKSGGSSGFNGLLAGYRYTCDGSFDYWGAFGLFWSSTQDASTTAWYRYLNSAYATVLRANYNKADGFSVRCLRD